MHVHGRNLEQKENHKTKYRDEESRRYLREIREKYNHWKLAHENLIGPRVLQNEEDSGVIRRRVELLNEYKDFIDRQDYAEKFDSRSNLHSSVLYQLNVKLHKMNASS